MQSKLLNIPSYLEDNCYAYKMPSFILKTQQGKGKTIITRILNLDDVARALRFTPGCIIQSLLKFFGHELNMKTNEKESALDGSVTEPELRKLLDKFLDMYLLCPKCKYPEMRLHVKENEIRGSCYACGNKPILDNKHKIAAYIINNTPSDALQPKKKEKKTEETKYIKMDERGIPDILTKKGDEFIRKVNIIYKQHSQIETFDDKPELVKEIIAETQKLALGENKNKISYVLFNAIFDVNIAREIDKNKAILIKADEELQITDVELDILLNLEVFLFVKHKSSEFEKYVPTFLKLFYDTNLLTEEFLVSWGENKHNSKMIMDFRYSKSLNDEFKAAAMPFLSWLE